MGRHAAAAISARASASAWTPPRISMAVSVPEICARICALAERGVLAHAHTFILNQGMNSGARSSRRGLMLAFVKDYIFFLN